MSTSQPSTPTSTPTQSATERRAAEAELLALIAKHAPAHAQLIGAARKALRKRLPTAQELVYEYRSWIVISFSPSAQGFEGVLAIRADSGGVQLYFSRGKELPDPDKLLKGSASLVRFVGLESAATLARPAVMSLMDGAIARNPVPFASDGRGSVVIRSSSATKRPRPKSAKSAKSPSKKAPTARKASAARSRKKSR